MLARQRFPGGVDASPPDAFQFQKAVAATYRYIQEGATVIYEAAFQYEGVLAAVDILVQRKGKWYAYEVKSTGSVKDPHLLDAAFQYYVIKNAGIPLSDFFILHLNTDYVRYGSLDVKELFTPASVLNEIKEQQSFIKTKLPELKQVLQLKKEPAIEPGDHCFKPYDCDFYGYCTQEMEEEEADWGEPSINKDAIRSFVKQLQYPLYFMDFETWMTAVPEQDGHWPFRQVPFQFSMHIQRTNDAEVEHVAYLAEGPHVHHREFAEQLLVAAGTQGSVLVYNKTFENGILKHLKEEFEDLAKAIEQLQERLVDLMPPFRKHYRLPEMRGCYSIKYVLPALVPELSYKELEIGNGTDASTAFYSLRLLDNKKEIQTLREGLLKYCELDTWAMVRILEKLKQL
ncbi:MAG: DUF2779 domain-containing protein [Lacibacter sp.]|jgi:predicted RecB family nuclease